MKEYTQYELAQTKRNFSFDQCLENKTYASEFLENSCDKVIEDFELVVNVPNDHPEFKSKSLKSKRNRTSAATTALRTLGFKKEDFSHDEWKDMITKVRNKIKSVMATTKFYLENCEDVKKRQKSKRQERALKKQCISKDISESPIVSVHNSLAEESGSIPEHLPHPALSSTLLELPSSPTAEEYDPSQSFSIEQVQIGNCIAIAQEPSRGIKYGKVLRVRSDNNDILVRYLDENDGAVINSGEEEWEKMSFIIHPDVRLNNGCISGKNIIISRYNKFIKHWFSKRSLTSNDIHQLLI